MAARAVVLSYTVAMNDHNTAPAGETDEQRDIRVNKDIAAFSYVWIMSVIIYIARKDSRFIQYHSKQGIVLFLLTIPAAMIPVIGNLLVLVIAGGMILGFIHAAQGKYEDVPLAGELSKGNMKVKDLVHAMAQLLEKLADLLKRMFHKSAQEPQKTPPSDSSVDTPPVTPVL